MQYFVFIHKRLDGVRFSVHANRYFDAILQLELILGPERHWISEYLVLSNGRVVAQQYAA